MFASRHCPIQESQQVPQSPKNLAGLGFLWTPYGKVSRCIKPCRPVGRQAFMRERYED